MKEHELVRSKARRLTWFGLEQEIRRIQTALGQPDTQQLGRWKTRLAIMESELARRGATYSLTGVVAEVNRELTQIRERMLPPIPNPQHPSSGSGESQEPASTGQRSTWEDLASRHQCTGPLPGSRKGNESTAGIGHHLDPAAAISSAPRSGTPRHRLFEQLRMVANEANRLYGGLVHSPAAPVLATTAKVGSPGIATSPTNHREVSGPNHDLRQPSGFTLIELLCVISVIAILLAMAVPSVARAYRACAARAAWTNHWHQVQVTTMANDPTPASMDAALISPDAAWAQIYPTLGSTRRYADVSWDTIRMIRTSTKLLGVNRTVGGAN